MGGRCNFVAVIVPPPLNLNANILKALSSRIPKQRAARIPVTACLGHGTVSATLLYTLRAFLIAQQPFQRDLTSSRFWVAAWGWGLTVRGHRPPSAHYPIVLCFRKEQPVRYMCSGHLGFISSSFFQTVKTLYSINKSNLATALTGACIGQKPA